MFRDSWDRPITKIAVGSIAILAATAKILEFVLRPSIPNIAKYSIWVVLLLTAFVPIMQITVAGVNRLIERALEQRMLRGEPIVISEEVTSEMAYLFDSQVYGMAYEDLIVHCTICDDGSAVIRREISEISHYMLLPEAPQYGEDFLELVDVKSLDRFTTLTPQVLELSSGRMSLRVFISPPVNPGDHIKYQVTERTPPGLYAVTGLEERKVPFDYLAWDIWCPTKRLEMRVFFPEGVRPRDFAHDAWYSLGQGRSRHHQEYRRVKAFLQDSQEGVYYTLAAIIPYPVLGLSYVIKWTPPRPK
jgi:hypothetical protein